MVRGRQSVIEHPDSLAGLLRFARVTAEVGTKEILQELHISSATLTKIERGLKQPDGEFLGRYWNALGKLSKIPLPTAYWEKIMQVYQEEQGGDAVLGENQDAPVSVEQREPEVAYYLVEAAKNKLNGQQVEDTSSNSPIMGWTREGGKWKTISIDLPEDLVPGSRERIEHYLGHQCTSFTTLFSRDGLTIVKSCNTCPYVEVAQRKFPTTEFEHFREAQ